MATLAEIASEEGGILYGEDDRFELRFHIPFDQPNGQTRWTTVIYTGLGSEEFEDVIAKIRANLPQQQIIWSLIGSDVIGEPGELVLQTVIPL
jgi:hypothetical protein